MYLSLLPSSYIDVIALNETVGSSDTSVVRLKFWNAFLCQLLFNRNGWTVYIPNKSSHVILRVYIQGYSQLCYLLSVGGHLGSYEQEMLCYAKSLQSCPTLCDPIDGNPPGSPVPGILQARTLEWVAISFSNVWKWSRPFVSNSSRPHGLQPTRLLYPWDFPGTV